jgi:RNA polymerase sigma-70 factor (ECF subfamily)
LHVPIEDVAAQLHSPPNQHERLEIRDFKRALKELPESYKTVILLVGLEGITYRQAADILGVPIGTVMSRLSRGREMLRRRMNGGDHGNGENHEASTLEEFPEVEVK